MKHRSGTAGAFGLLPIPGDEAQASDFHAPRHERRLTIDAYPRAPRGKANRRVLLVLCIVAVLAIVSAPLSYAVWQLQH
jgi:hypothetical protein